MERISSKKKQYVSLDYMKFICSLLVVYIHVPAFADIQPDLNFFMKQVLCRIAVPLFYICSGFLIAEKIKTRAIKEYVKRIAELYILYTVLYFPFTYLELFKTTNSTIMTIVAFIQRFLFSGSFQHLWFFTGLIVAVLVMSALINRFHLSDYKILMGGGTLYIIGTICLTYVMFLERNASIFKAFQIYKTIFLTTKNGIFFSFPYIAIGYVLKRNRYRLKISISKLFLPILMAFCMVGFEAVFASKHGANNMDMLFTLPVLSVLVFIAVINVKIDKSVLGTHMRKLSTLIYGFHYMIRMISGEVLKDVGIETDSLIRYLITICLSLVLSETVIRMSCSKKFQWLRVLY